MRGIWAIWAIGAAGLGAACIPEGTFACEQSDQCSRLAGGVCEADGHCSYSDPGCDSGRRYSDFAGALAGTCVPVAEGTGSGSSGSTSSPEDTSGSGSSDGSDDVGSTGLPGSCDGVDCSGQGTCVEIDGAPTCACDPGLYAVGLSCLPDPCDSATCYFIDADEGDDDADGSRQTPWQTIGRLEDALAEATPGDHFLLRRDRQWTDQLDIVNVTGGLDAPVVVGAYGPVDEPRPRLLPGSVRIARSEQVVVRDLWIEDDPDAPEGFNRPCVLLDDSRQLVILGSALVHCTNRGIRYTNGTAYTVIVDNTIRDLDRTAVFLADTTWDETMAPTGPHHWVIDNVIHGLTAENGIRVGLSDATADVKLVGNRIADVVGDGILVSTGGWVWAVRNVVARTGDEVGGVGEGIDFDADGPISGNVLVRARGLEFSGAGSVDHNTVVYEGSVPAVEVEGGAQSRVLVDNLVLARGGNAWVQLGNDPADDVAMMDHNWYATDGEPCLLRAMGMDLDLPGFTALTGFDAGSQCAPAPGFGDVPVGLLPEDWDEAFWSSLRPDGRWAWCDDPAGAFDCDGAPLPDRIEPIAEYPENAGYGWSGPLLVRQRYETDP